MPLSPITVKALEEEDYLVFTAASDDGQVLDDEQCSRLFSLPAMADFSGSVAVDWDLLSTRYKQKEAQIIEEIGQRNAIFFDEEMDKLDFWASDQQNSLKTSLKELGDQIKELKRQIRQTNTLPEKIALQKKVKELEKRRDDAWRAYDQAAREIEKKKDELIDIVESRLKQTIQQQQLFKITWTIT